MPAPLAPVTVTGVASTSTRRDAPLGTVSVVAIARTAAYHPPGVNAAAQRGKASTILSTGSGSMITPVRTARPLRRAIHLPATAAQVSRVGQFGVAGAGVGIAGVDQERSRLTFCARCCGRR
jgi:hypothetical protein